MCVFGFESSPPAITTLHADHPFGSASHRIAIIDFGIHGARAMHGYCHHRRIVDIGVMRIGILESPTARSPVRTAYDPLAAGGEDLQRTQPFKAALCRLNG